LKFQVQTVPNYPPRNYEQLLFCLSNRQQLYLKVHQHYDVLDAYPLWALILFIFLLKPMNVMACVNNRTKGNKEFRVVYFL